MTAVLEWLWDNAAGPVLDLLNHHRRPSAEADWPRVWWVPGGALGLLPLHAAGQHTDPADDACRRTYRHGPGGLLLHADHPRLAPRPPHQWRSGEPDPTERDVPATDLPTKAAVLRHLPDCPIAHFACHGASHPVDPSRSLLLLHDHASDPFTAAAVAFYSHLRTPTGALDTGRSAWALHQAVRALRDGHDLPGTLDRTKVPFLWAAYLHTGA
ncbi:hypothetical protein [Streptomyces sp. NPDC057877]|uniref:hypothetical protein n=1 Tax=Streptomyces sp. NPDC057877 TaxID=3346269 RepID=UPI0036C000EF